MKKIKEKLRRLKQEALESFNGISKGALATMVWIETLLVLITLAVCLACLQHSVSSEILTQQALDLKDTAVDNLNEYKAQNQSYKSLYELTLKELNDSKEVTSQSQ